MSESSSQKFIPDLFVRAKEVTFDVVLGELGLLNQLKVAGDEIRGTCPLCGGERSFSANPVKGVFNCFRCRKNKDVIDFVKFYKKVLWFDVLVEGESIQDFGAGDSIVKEYVS